MHDASTCDHKWTDALHNLTLLSDENTLSYFYNPDFSLYFPRFFRPHKSLPKWNRMRAKCSMQRASPSRNLMNCLKVQQYLCTHASLKISALYFNFIGDLT